MFTLGNRSIAVEGNVGCGKTTFLNYLQQKFPNRINIYCEPVHRWRNVNGINLFDLMYKDPKRYGFIFQSYVQLTMLEMHDEISQKQTEQINEFKTEQAKLEFSKLEKSKLQNKVKIFSDLTNKDQKIEINDKKRKSSPNDELSSFKKVLKTNYTEKKTEFSLDDLISNAKSKETIDYSINMMERSIFSARYIFVENLYQNKLLTDIEYKILDETFLFLIKKQKIELDLIVYLRSEPEECYNRMLKRSRPEETQTLQIEHFKKFHKLHEDFLIGQDSLIKRILDVPILVIDTMDSKEKMFERIDQHSLFIMNDLISKRDCLKEIICDSN